MDGRGLDCVGRGPDCVMSGTKSLYCSIRFHLLYLNKLVAGLVLGGSTGRVSLTTKGSGGTAHTCSGRHSQYSCELLSHGLQDLLCK